MAGGLFQRIAGTVSSFFQLGGPGGAGVQSTAGPPVSLDCRNAANTAFVVARAADPTTGIGASADNALVTKHYEDKNFVQSFLLMGG